MGGCLVTFALEEIRGLDCHSSNCGGALNRASNSQCCTRCCRAPYDLRFRCSYELAEQVHGRFSLVLYSLFAYPRTVVECMSWTRCHLRSVQMLRDIGLSGIPNLKCNRTGICLPCGSMQLQNMSVFLAAADKCLSSLTASI